MNSRAFQTRILCCLVCPQEAQRPQSSRTQEMTAMKFLLGCCPHTHSHTACSYRVDFWSHRGLFSQSTLAPGCPWKLVIVTIILLLKRNFWDHCSLPPSLPPHDQALLPSCRHAARWPTKAFRSCLTLALRGFEGEVVMSLYSSGACDPWSRVCFTCILVFCNAPSMFWRSSHSFPRESFGMGSK